jgi:hypothetical protein
VQHHRRHSHRQGENAASWLKRADEASERLKDMQRKIKYPLGGIVSGVRELTRLSAWVKHLNGEPQGKRRTELINAAESLRVALDRAIQDAFLSGRPPTWLATRRVADATKRLRGLWDQGQTEESAVLELQESTAEVLALPSPEAQQTLDVPAPTSVTAPSRSTRTSFSPTP